MTLEADRETGEVLEVSLEAVQQNESAVDIPPFNVTRYGLQVTGKPTYEQWRAFAINLRGIKTAVQFAIGDWINYGEATYGEKYAQALDETDFDYDTLRNYAYIARQIEMSRRRDNLSYSKQAAVAPLPPAQQEQVLSKAQSMSRDEVREAVSALQGKPIHRRERISCDIDEMGNVKPASREQLKQLRIKDNFEAHLIVTYTEKAD